MSVIQLSDLSDFLTIPDRNQNKLTFDENLQANIDRLIAKLSFLKNNDEIDRCLRTRLKLSDLEIGSDGSGGESIRWRFLRLLIYVLVEAVDSRADLMSVRNIQNLKKSFAFIGRLGITMNLSDGFKCLVRSQTIAATATELEPEQLTEIERFERVYVCTKAFYLFLVEFVEHFRPLLIGGHVHEILSGLLALRFARRNSSMPDSHSMFEWLMDNLHQPTLVKELLALLSNRTSDPNLVAFVTRTLNRIVTATETGVESVIRVVYDSLVASSNYSSNTGSNSNWSQVDFLARLLSRIRNQQSIATKLFALVDRNAPTAVFLDRGFVIEVLATLMKYLHAAPNSLTNFQLYFEQFESLVRNLFVSETTAAVALQLTYHLFVTECKLVRRLEIGSVREFYPLFFRLYYRLCDGREPHEYRSRFANDLHAILMRIAETPFDFDDVFEPSTDFNIKFKCSIENGQLKLKDAVDDAPDDDDDDNDGLLTFVIEHVFAGHDNQLRNLFDYLLRKSLGDVDDETATSRTYCRRLIYLQHLIDLLANRSTIVTKHLTSTNPKSLIEFVREFLRRNIARKVHLSCGRDTDTDRYQQLFVALVFLKTIFEQIDSFDSYRVSVGDLLTVVKTEATAGSELQRLASELCTALDRKRAGAEVTSPTQPLPPSESHYRQMVRDLIEGEDFVRGHALIELTRMLETGDETALANEQYLMHLFVESMESDESYVFLSAINGLVTLSDRFPNVVIETLCDRYVNWQRSAASVAETELRIKLGESLVRISRRLNEMLIKYRSQLVHAFLCAARDPDPALRTSALANLAEVCRVLNYRLASTLAEILMCVRAILCDGSGREHVEPQRAACFVLSELLRGLDATDSSAIYVLKDHLLDTYRLLRRICDAPVTHDAVLVRHAATALDLLDTAAKRFLQPPPSYL